MEKRNRSLIFSTVILFLAGGVLLLIGLALNGWNIAEWFCSKFFYALCICVTVYILIVLYFLFREELKK